MKDIMWRGKYALGIAGALLSGAIACSDCSEETEQLEAFLAAPANLQCDSVDDCVVQSVGCAAVESAFCGQVAVNAVAANSQTWKELQSDAVDCNGTSCTQCNAILVARCEAGVCR